MAKPPWPAALPEQVAAVACVLAEAAAPLSVAEPAARFTGKGRVSSACRNCSILWSPWAKHGRSASPGGLQP